MKLGTARDLVTSARKGFMTKVHRRPWCQEYPGTYVKSLEIFLPFSAVYFSTVKLSVVQCYLSLPVFLISFLFSLIFPLMALRMARVWQGQRWRRKSITNELVSKLFVDQTLTVLQYIIFLKNSHHGAIDL